MAQESQNKGFNLPPPGKSEGAATPAAPSAPATGSPQTSGVSITLATPSDTSTRDVAIGVGVMIVLLIAFFFAKNAYANWLVGRKVSPRSANAAGWWLFIFLSCLAAAGVFPLASQATFLSAIFLGPVLLVAGAALVLLLLSSRR
jgi:hypothetical protein